jgi:pimeloyl-ACP methyl ester carboxylesterase
MSDFSDEYWQSADGLRLHYRDYPAKGGEALPPVLCLPGLTRNARDFAQIAQRLSQKWRVICPDMRGRGDSDYSKNSETYNPMHYVQDVNLLLDALGVERFVVIGTSLGGLMAMILAMIDAKRLAGVVLNDIGPVVEAEGLARIRDYVGQGRSYPTWMHAARDLEEDHAAAFPDYDAHDWLAMAKRVMVLGQNGRIVYDYDMRIAEPFEKPGGEAGVDLWPGFDALAGRPLLIVRGGLSDVFSGATLAEMLRRNGEAEAVTLPRIGHAPTLDEPEAVAAIERMLARVAGA